MADHKEEEIPNLENQPGEDAHTFNRNEKKCRKSLLKVGMKQLTGNTRNTLKKNLVKLGFWLKWKSVSASKWLLKEFTTNVGECLLTCWKSLRWWRGGPSSASWPGGGGPHSRSSPWPPRTPGTWRSGGRGGCQPSGPPHPVRPLSTPPCIIYTSFLDFSSGFLIPADIPVQQKCKLARSATSSKSAMSA